MLLAAAVAAPTWCVAQANFHAGLAALAVSRPEAVCRIGSIRAGLSPP